MAESNTRNVVLIVAALVVLAAVLLLFSSGKEESEDASVARPPSTTQAVPTPSPESRRAPRESDQLARAARPDPSPAPGLQPATARDTRAAAAEERITDYPIEEGIEAEAARVRMEQFEQAFSPEFVEALRYPKKPELSPEELDRLQNRPLPTQGEQEFLLRHGEEAADLRNVPDLTAEPDTGALTPEELEMLENPALEVR